MHNRAVLASIEMTPAALGLMIVEPAFGAALATAVDQADQLGPDVSTILLAQPLYERSQFAQHL
jgi:hypothetical protein